MGGAVRAVLGGGGQRRAVLGEVVNGGRYWGGGEWRGGTGGRWSTEGGTGGEVVKGGRYWGGGERRAVLGRR